MPPHKHWPGAPACLGHKAWGQSRGVSAWRGGPRGTLKWFPGQPRSAAPGPAPPPCRSAPPRRESRNLRPQVDPREAVCPLTSQRVVHATNATVQLQDTQRFHSLATATAAWKLGLPVLRLSYSLCPLPSLLVPRLFSSPNLLFLWLQIKRRVWSLGASRG